MKKYLIVFVLTITFLFSSFYVQTRKADAVVPLALWVGINVAAALTVGAIMYFTKDNGDIALRQISNVNTSTGQVDFIDTFLGSSTDSIVYTNQNDGKKFYPVLPGMDSIWSNTTQWTTLTNTSMSQALANAITGSNVGFWIYMNENGDVKWKGVISATDTFLQDTNIGDPFLNDPVPGGMGNVYSGTIGATDQGPILDLAVDFYEFEEDVPQLPDCFDGIQNQDETGVDCGGVCELNFGLVCPPAETCFDGIMNQDETGIDYGGVCGTGTPVSQPPGNFTDANQDGIDDISGLDDTGSIPVGTVSGSVGTADSSTYDASLPGDVSEVGETDWTGLITGYLASNPLVLLATDSQINVTGATCSLPMTLFGKSMTIDFCSLDWMVDLFGSFVLGLMAIRAVFIAMGV